MKKYILLFLFGILLFELTFVVSSKFFFDTKEEFAESEVKKLRKLELAQNNTEVKQTSFEEEKVGQNTKFKVIESYTDCEHKKEVITDIDKKMINLNEDEFKKKYPEYKIKNFSRDEILALKMNEGFCDEHFKIVMGEDFIEVLKLNSNVDEELYLVTGISRDYLAEDDIKKLDKGIEVFGKENINSKLEDYE